LATAYLNRNSFFQGDSRTSNLSLEEENELDALDMVIGLSSEERSYLLAVWRASSKVELQTTVEWEVTMP